MKRRNFISTTAVGAAGSFFLNSSHAADGPKLAEGDVILFQGDSITDAGRNKKDPVANEGLGRGYASVLGPQLLAAHTALNLQVHNRGVGGNKVPNLEARWEADCIQLKPKVLSILIGVNDIWHKMDGRYDGTAEVYRDGFTALLERTRKALPDTTFVICQPFVLKAGTVKANWDKWFPDFATRRSYAKDVADKAGALWVPFQDMFDKAVADGTEPAHWAKDGVHPTADGHALMAKEWRKVVGI